MTPATNSLVDEISKQLSITRASESVREWSCRVIYSAVGKMALASLWDSPEDESSVSIQHFKKRAEEICSALLAICPEAEPFFSVNRDWLFGELYTIYRRTGYLYHSPYQASPAARTTAAAEKITFFRGLSPDINASMSGLGLYRPDIAEAGGQSVAQMYELQEQPMQEYLEELLSAGEWQEIDWPQDSCFLRLSPSFSQGYWKEAPDRDGRISLAYYGNINRIYVFYYYNDGRPLQKQLPAWRTRDFRAANANDQGEYRRIANALLLRYNSRPSIRVKIYGGLALIQTGYRLPPAEEDFFKLYSWPVNYDIDLNKPQVFARKMALSVYPVFKKILEAAGYHFMEE